MFLSFLKKEKYLLLLLLSLFLSLSFSPSVFAQSSFADAVGGGTVNTAATLLNPLLALFVWITKFIFQLASQAFLWIVDFTILDFGRYWSGEGAAFDGLTFIWEFIRDFVNFFIVIFFLSIAMVTSFGDGSFGFHRKTLVFLLILAVLINFSAFFTLFFIDISHMLFAVFLNISQIELGARLLLFDEYGSFFTSQGSPVLNLFLRLAQITANWFLALGFFYFCLILIQRFFVAVLLIISSPLAALGFTLKFSGSSNPFSGVFIGAWDFWENNFLNIIVTPIVLIFGLSVIVSIFNAILGEAVRPENLPAAQGVMSNMALFTQLLVATTLLVYGIFKVGNMAQELKLGVGKYRLGGLAKKVGEWHQSGTLKTLKGRPFAGVYKAVKGAVKSIPGAPAAGARFGASRVGRAFSRVKGAKEYAGQSGRTVAATAKAVASGKGIPSREVWEDLKEKARRSTFKQFEDDKKAFDRMDRDALRNLSSQDLDRYNRLVRDLEGVFDGEDREKRARQGKMDPQLEGYRRVMDDLHQKATGAVLNREEFTPEQVRERVDSAVTQVEGSGFTAGLTESINDLVENEQISSGFLRRIVSLDGVSNDILQNILDNQNDVDADVLGEILSRDTVSDSVKRSALGHGVVTADLIGQAAANYHLPDSVFASSLNNNVVDEPLLVDMLTATDVSDEKKMAIVQHRKITNTVLNQALGRQYDAGYDVSGGVANAIRQRKRDQGWN